MGDDAPGWDCHVHVFGGGPALPQAHYAPPLCTLAMLEAASSAIAASRFVLVQPSIYGTDNGLLLEALQTGAGRHRGVVVVDAAAEGQALQRMHALGVRGVRCNLVSPVGNSATGLPQLAPRLREMGWHVQWHAEPRHLAGISAFHERHGLTGVLDHLSGFTPSHAANLTAWSALQRFADGGGWLKLSGWYRLRSSAPYADLHDTIRRAAELFGNRTVWGSDWPHTQFLEPGRHQAIPGYGQTWEPVPQSIGIGLADQVLRLHPQRLYA